LSLLGGAGALAGAAGARAHQEKPAAPRWPSGTTPEVGKGGRGRPVAISSSNGLRAVEDAIRRLRAGTDPLDAVVAAVGIVEADPDDMTVGYGGIPNAEGVVELDAAIMDGRTGKAGSVAAVRNIKHPAALALRVLQRTTRVLLVGEGALAFARAQGFAEDNLLTERARKVWLYWRESLSRHDDWIPAPGEQLDPDIQWFFEKYGTSEVLPEGTIHLSLLDPAGNLVGATTTSGLFFKIPGRVGDSPIIGAGVYADGAVGSCGSTGWGDGNLRLCGAHTVVELMRHGMAPEEACLRALARLVEIAPERLDQAGRPSKVSNLKFYAVDREGRYAGAALWDRDSDGIAARYAVHDGERAELRDCAYLFRRG
jgi:N4-(beta-N-acetylglucosaminyl)-L-asparaginase